MKLVVAVTSMTFTVRADDQGEGGDLGAVGVTCLAR